MGGSGVGGSGLGAGGSDVAVAGAGVAVGAFVAVDSGVRDATADPGVAEGREVSSEPPQAIATPANRQMIGSSSFFMLS